MQELVVDGRRARGDASRRAVLTFATDLASVGGLDGLSIGQLATASGHSKSSIAGLFQNKEGLQLATVAAGREVFIRVVVEPAREHERGLARLVALMHHLIEYSRTRVFTGGCFFAAITADVDSKPGPVRDAVRQAMALWYDYIAVQVRYAVDSGELRLDADGIEQVAFTLPALYEQANARSLLYNSDEPYRLAARGMRDLLTASGADPAALALLRR
ncbi:TetR family transcriptional regulator C-terminal domain-containing protein [Microbacterium sp. 2216-1]|uniref:TetR family transcriptional regulator C-terminal domain-containing protein n=1 Tax=Microbacterium TaxID=33882 RepID=UPI001CD46B08|nr:TetR/AcrR family transcriptional regulator [Microbacterium esteraromaticum]MCA1306778.1 TetR/AcrR family transcriptional regulator [Microbacterium esteraromaticum]